MDFGRAENLLRDVVAPVVEGLISADGRVPPVMIVGAACRDVLHLAEGHTSVLLRTSDLDIALVVAGWESFDALTLGLEKSGDSGIRYIVGGVPVDIVPFGDIEVPDGVVTPAGRREVMSVFGFKDVWESAQNLPLPSGRIVRLPTVAGYALLKMKAWADRSSYGQYKDGADLACSMFWYQRSQNVFHRLYDTEQGQSLLVAADFDIDVAAIWLLADDVSRLLTPSRRAELRGVWASVEDSLLTANLGNPALQGWPARGDSRLAQYVRTLRAALERGLSTSSGV